MDMNYKIGDKADCFSSFNFAMDFSFPVLDKCRIGSNKLYIFAILFQ